MSVDLVGTMHTPVPLDVLVDAAGETLARLLGLKAAPVIEVVAERRFELGRPVHEGRRLLHRELGTLLIGERATHSADQRPHERDVDFRVTGWEDTVGLIVFDPCEVLDHEEVTDEQLEPVEAVFSPERTCVGVVTATALALTAGSLGGGRFVDAEISMLPRPESNPARMVELTRLPDRGDDFVERCERFMRQFARLNGWPRDVRLPPGPGAVV
ncbi:hypothetical protein [Streptomyces sp. NPDC002324]